MLQSIMKVFATRQSRVYGGMIMEHRKWSSFSNFWKDVQKNNREKREAEYDDIANYEMFRGIDKTIAALREVGIENEKIIYLLQKYWDLRRSEAEELLQQEELLDE